MEKKSKPGVFDDCIKEEAKTLSFIVTPSEKIFILHAE
jgi:hypothetical protein